MRSRYCQAFLCARWLAGLLLALLAARGVSPAHAAPSTPDTVAAQAQHVVAGLPASDAHARALALCDWVRRNLPHAGRAPDGRDHALLLQALLAEVGIGSTPALVNDGVAYGLPDGPDPAVLNHMLVYIPALGLYLAPAASAVQAGYLPPGVLGKPVLFVDSGRFAMTPLLQPQRVRTVASVVFGRDGRASVKAVRTVSGALAEPVRTALRSMPQAGRETLVRGVLLSMGLHGHGTLDRGRLADDGGDYAFSVSGAGLAAVAPITDIASTGADAEGIADAVARMWRASGARRNAGLAQPDRPCPAVDAEDTITYRLAPGARIPALPGPASVTAEGLFYRAGQAIVPPHAGDGDGDGDGDGAAVRVTRRLTFRHGRPTCTGADYRAMTPALARIRRDLDCGGVPGVSPSVSAAQCAAPAAVRAQRRHRRLVAEVEAQIDAVASRAVAGRPAGNLDEAAALEEAGRVRVRVDGDVARPQLASGHVQQAIHQQRTADAGAVAVGAHQAEHERAEVVETGQLVAAEPDHVAILDDDE
jgi:hypothetical protein